MEQILKDVFAVEVPEGAKDLHIEWNLNDTSQYVAYKFKDDLLANEYEQKQLPPGSYEILFTTKDCSSAKAASLVDHFHNGACRDYECNQFDPSDDLLPHCGSGTESLQSLLRSKNLDPAKNYLLIHKL